MDGAPEIHVHPRPEPARHDDEHHEVERERAETDGDLTVAREERYERVDDRDPRGLVEDETDDVRDAEREPDPRGEVVKRADRLLLGEEVEDRRPEREPGEHADAERRVGRDSRRAREDPERELRIHLATTYASA